MPEFEPVKKKSKTAKKKQGYSFGSLFPNKKDSAGEKVRKIVFLLAILILIGATCTVLYFYVFRSDSIEQEMKELQGMKGESNGKVISINIKDSENHTGTGDQPQKTVEILEEYADLYAAQPNGNMVGYVEIYPWIQSPVVQAEDNDYYLKHNFYDQPTENGTVFADYEVPITADSTPNNTIIYGHNLITRNMFEPLSLYRKNGIDFLKDNYIINYDTIYEKNQYFIFSVMLVNTDPSRGEVFDYQNDVTFNSKHEFNDFAAECLDRSYYYTGIDLQYGDELLTLSTCDFGYFEKDMRLVVVARRIRDDESPVLDPETFIDNRGQLPDGTFKRRMFDAFYKMNGSSGWGGRQWDTSWIKDYEE
ncbi:MAG: class B sortase [Firmicutes bacterium]|nr:class B sortase [[Eubacterium] siraeum]MCM1488100.1 class B sortase [Bacillota bacterium]